MNRDVHICRPETNLAMAAPTTFPFAGVELSRPSEIPRAATQLPFTFEDVVKYFQDSLPNRRRLVITSTHD